MLVFQTTGLAYYGNLTTLISLTVSCTCILKMASLCKCLTDWCFFPNNFCVYEFFYWLIFFYFESRLKINFKVNTLLSNDAVSWMIVMEKDFFLKIWMTAVRIFVSKHPVICFWFISVVNFVTLLSLT